MILAIDIGNSDIVFGWYQAQEWTHQLRVPVEAYLEVSIRLGDFMRENELGENGLEQIVLSSVVSGITPTVKNQVELLLKKAVTQLGPALFEQLNLGIDNTAEIGSDLVANAVAGFSRFQSSTIVVDFGTALTFTVIGPQGHIRGVTIAPGLGTAMRALASNTAQLPQVPLELPASAIGTTTPHALQAGIMLGYVGLVNELLDRMEEELGTKPKVIATGGLARKLTPLATRFDLIDPWLTLDGIRQVGDLARG